MKQGYTHIAFALDKSGSMGSIQDTTISKFNEFLQSQKALPGEATFSLLTFNDKLEYVNKFQPLNVVSELTKQTYQPGGMTAMNDAIGKLIDDTGKALAELPESERPAGVLIAICTDGEENASKNFSTADIRNKVKHQTDKYQWEFLFLGANIDVKKESQARGFDSLKSINFEATNMGTTKMYEDFHKFTASYRASK